MYSTISKVDSVVAGGQISHHCSSQHIQDIKITGGTKIEKLRQKKKSDNNMQVQNRTIQPLGDDMKLKLLKIY